MHVLHCVGLYRNRDACSSVTMYTYCVTVYIYERRIAYMSTLQRIHVTVTAAWQCVTAAWQCVMSVFRYVTTYIYASLSLELFFFVLLFYLVALFRHVPDEGLRQTQYDDKARDNHAPPSLAGRKRAQVQETKEER
jgi:hypothetical protein